MVKYNAKQISGLLMKSYFAGSSYQFGVPNVSYGMNLSHEADLLVLNRNDYLTEVG